MSVSSVVRAALAAATFAFSISEAQWIHGTNPEGDISIHDFAIAGDTIFAGTDRGVYVSSNSGSVWAPANDGLGDTTVNAMAITSQAVLAGTSSGLFRSTDWGATWQLTRDGMPDTNVAAFLVRDTMTFAGTSAGLFLSVNAGMSWSELPLSTTSRAVISIAASPTYLYVNTDQDGLRSSDWGESWVRYSGSMGTSFTVIGEDLIVGWNEVPLYSTDHGDTWQMASNKIGDKSFYCLNVVGSTVFAQTDLGPHRSTDRGRTWANPVKNLPSSIINVYRGTGSLVFAGTKGFGAYISTDAGVNWMASSRGFPPRQQYSLAAVGPVLFAAAGGEILRSTDHGISWSAVNIGPPYDRGILCLYGHANFLFAGTYDVTGGVARGVCSTSDLGETWALSASLYSVEAVTFMGPAGSTGDSLLFKGTTGGVWRAAFPGPAWSKVWPDTGAISYDALVLTLAVKDTILFAGTSEGSVYRTTDQGATWKDISSGLPGGYGIWKLAVLGGWVIASHGAAVYRTTDNGDTWGVGGLDGLPGLEPHPFVVSGGNAYAATGQSGVFVTLDSGASWSPWNPGDPLSVEATSLLVAGQYLVASSSQGLFSHDLGSPLPIQLASFEAHVDGTGHTMLTWRTLSESNNYGWQVQKRSAVPDYCSIPGALIAGHGTSGLPHDYRWTDTSAGGGRYYRLKQIDLDGSVHYSEAITVSTTTGAEDVSRLPLRYMLEKNYPNPFNPSTQFRFSLPHGARVSLVVYDVLGRQVAVLAEGYRDAGYYSAAWNGSSAASGIYIARLAVYDAQGNLKISTANKLVLMK